ncbi:MAG: phosphate acetyltransferase [Candidatus Woesearchaeota archaeon]
MKSSEFLEAVFSKAKTLQRRIVFDEIDDERIIEAVKIIKREKIANPVLVVPQNRVSEFINLGVEIVEITDKKKEEFTDIVYELRRNKNTREEIRQWFEDSIYFATVLVYLNQADGLISGAMHTTGHTIKPAFQIIKTKEPFTISSGAFFMLLEDVYLFADCSNIPNPSEQELSQIAVQTGITALQFGIEPYIAMLSFSTKGSAKHELVDKVVKATELAKNLSKNLMLDLIIDGELQADAALVESVAKIKAKESSVAGKARVLIFPDLDAGNIGYKLVERLGKATAIGPILQGLKKPVNDLSRGCKVSDIVQLSAITALQTQD